MAQWVKALAEQTNPTYKVCPWKPCQRPWKQAYVSPALYCETGSQRWKLSKQHKQKQESTVLATRTGESALKVLSELYLSVMVRASLCGHAHTHNSQTNRCQNDRIRVELYFSWWSCLRSEHMTKIVYSVNPHQNLFSASFTQTVCCRLFRHITWDQEQCIVKFLLFWVGDSQPVII